MDRDRPNGQPQKCLLVSKPPEKQPELQLLQVKEIIGYPANYTDSECAAAVRQIMKHRISYTEDEYANASKYVIWHPKSFTEEEFNFVAKKVFEEHWPAYQDKHQSDQIEPINTTLM